MNPRILFIDDEEPLLATFKRMLSVLGLKNVRTEGDPRKAVELFEDNSDFFDIAFIDINMPYLNGLEVLEFIKTQSPETECIMVSATNELKTAVQCLRKGAYDYIVKPVTGEELVNACHRALERRKLLEIVELSKKPKTPALKNPSAFRNIVTNSDKMLRIMKEAELHAASDVPVLITGESGTGKELLAKAVHASSSRAAFAFTAINMASVNDNLFESEFFGHTKGAFTGAGHQRPGYLEKTDGGTLFLDEIGILSPELQAKLLRILQEGDFFKIGSDSPKKIDIRFVAATNEDLEKQVERGNFRKDLYYRLRGAWLHLPPLREKREDIQALIAKFMADCGSDNGMARIDKEALEVLVNYEYPGNIRELKSIVQSSLNLCENGVVTIDALPEFLTRNTKPAAAGKMRSPKNDQPAEKKILPLSEIEKNHIVEAYELTGQNKLKTARLLGISPNTLRSKLKSYGYK